MSGAILVLPPYAFMEQTGTTLMIYHIFSSLLYSYFVSVVKEMTQQMLHTSSALGKKIQKLTNLYW
jgi:hypothetical protein